MLSLGGLGVGVRYCGAVLEDKAAALWEWLEKNFTSCIYYQMLWYIKSHEHACVRDQTQVVSLHHRLTIHHYPETVLTY